MQAQRCMNFCKATANADFFMRFDLLFSPTTPCLPGHY
jgi:hypothetical protein